MLLLLCLYKIIKSVTINRHRETLTDSAPPPHPRVTQVASNSFSALLRLRLLDLSGNQLVLLHPQALSISGSPLQQLNLSRSLFNSSAVADLGAALRWGGLGGLLSLDLSGNRLASLQPAMFSYLPGLRRLLLGHNLLAWLPAGTFSGLGRLQELDLSHNRLRTLGAEALQELATLGDLRLLLGHNPYSCSCDIRPLVAWLNQSRARLDVEALRCAEPRTLNRSRLWGLSPRMVGCEGPAQPAQAGGTHLDLQTSYVFLGLVLGLVGLVFLLVLYLNRRGMRAWLLELRDACRDVMEGYHYRYEMDSDPRLAHIAAAHLKKHRGLDPTPQMPSDTCITQVPETTLVKSRTGPQPLGL